MHAIFSVKHVIIWDYIQYIYTGVSIYGKFRTLPTLNQACRWMYLNVNSPLCYIVRPFNRLQSRPSVPSLNRDTVKPRLSDIRSTYIPDYPTHYTELSTPRYPIKIGKQEVSYLLILSLIKVSDWNVFWTNQIYSDSFRNLSQANRDPSESIRKKISISFNANG